MEKGASGESFELPVDYNGKEELFPARLVRMGYTYKIYVQAGETEVTFEPDEERNFRAIITDPVQQNTINRNLVSAIGEALDRHLRD